MIKNQAIFLLFLTFLNTISFSSIAVKAYPYPVEYTQPDGSTISIILKGDERVKWAKTIDGYSILKNGKGYFEYAIHDSKKDLVPSGVIAKNVKERDINDLLFLSKTEKGLKYSNSQISMLKSISKLNLKGSQKTFPTTGARKLICILIGFTDKPFTKTQNDFNNLFNQIGYNADGATGSVKDYYLENSYNQLNLTITIAGPYIAANNMAYYGGNDTNGDDLRPNKLVEEAVTLANTSVNYADFDNDNDGYVDGVYVIYAGFGEEAGGNENTIWAHAWSINKVFDGKIITNYSCSSELRGNTGTGISRIGVICHEFGHVLGANDYYDTDYDDNGEYIGTGKWDIMADGSWNNNGATPPHHNPYTKINDYNWATATTISTGNTFTISNSAENSNSFYRINTTTPNEYFLIENRQRLKFDSYVPGQGMMIFHVDGNFINSNPYEINTTNHQGMYPVCAGATGNPPSEYGSINSNYCPFPGIGLKTSFTDNTTPHSKSWLGANTNKPITNITENNTLKTITFTVSVSTDVSSERFLHQNYLSQNYPNPFNQSTSIDFSIIENDHVIISVYNTLGKLVDIITDENYSPGSYTKQWIPKNLPNGIYFYQIQSHNYKETKRLIIGK
ncbi:MAG: M6 family metalloprotease domain-containing protein [Tenuifilaceae bacterium]